VSDSHPEQTQSEAQAGLRELHRYGSASESLFRRLYRSFNRRRSLEHELQQQRALTGAAVARSEALEAQVQRLQTLQRGQGDELQRLQAVLTSLNEGIIAQDPAGKVTMMNRAALDMLGSKKQFWESELGNMFERSRDLPSGTAQLMPLGESDEILLNERILRAQLIVIGDENQGSIGTVILLRDMSYAALAQRLKDGFVAQLAQDMSKPATVLKLGAELLSAQPEDSAVNERLLKKMLQNVDAVARISRELADIGRIQAGNLDVQREPLALEAVVWAGANELLPELRSRQLDLLVMTRRTSAVQVRGDAMRLQWALRQLVHVAARRKPDGGFLQLTVRVEQQGQQPFIIIELRSNGQVEVELQASQGLQIAKVICEAHGGRLEMHNRAWSMHLPQYTP